MNASTTTNTYNNVSASADENELARVLDMDRIEARRRNRQSTPAPANRVLRFIAELRRRQVCRTITMYSVALWVICQIVDVISPQLGLPEWTMKMVIVLGLIGYPIALILSWVFDITKDGALVEDRGIDAAESKALPARGPFDQIVDCSLLLVALLIGLQLATGILTNDAYSAPPVVRKVSVLPMHVSASDNAEFLSQHLTSEVQHEIASATGLTVIAHQERFLDAGCFTLTGAVATTAAIIRVTATLIDNRTGEITWTRAFDLEATEPTMLPETVAKEIVASLPLSLLEMDGAGDVDAT